METSLPQTIVSCTQCGGELHPDEGQLFLDLPVLQFRRLPGQIQGRLSLVPGADPGRKQSAWRARALDGRQPDRQRPG